jgi:hypothetical protein
MRKSYSRLFVPGFCVPAMRNLCAGGVAWALAGAAVAQVGSNDASATEDWRFQITPYVWMSGLDGQVQPFRGAPTAHVEKSFADVLSNLNAAAFVTGSARKGRLVLHGDLSHASTSDSAALPMGLFADARVRQTSMTLAAGRNWQEGRSSFDLLGGVRLWEIQARVNVAGLASARSNSSFTDPILAARWRYELAPQWSSLVYVDAGGFGVGSDSTWQWLGTLNYQWRENVYWSLGYRYLRVNYRSDGKRLDFSQGGPLLGITFRF